MKKKAKRADSSAHKDLSGLFERRGKENKGGDLRNRRTNGGDFNSVLAGTREIGESTNCEAGRIGSNGSR